MSFGTLEKSRPYCKMTKQHKSSKHIKSKTVTKTVTKTKQKKNKKSHKSYGGMSSMMSENFAMVLKDPFGPQAFGARVPDPFSFPTAVYHLHGNVQLVGNSTYPSGSVLFLPNPVLSMIDCGAANGGQTSITTNAAGSALTQFSSSTFCYGATAPTNIANNLATWRIVTWGLKISNLQPELTATGRVIIAPICIGDTIPSYNVLSSTALNGSSCVNNITGGINSQVITSNGVLNLPGAFEVAVQDLLHGDIELGCSVTGPEFFRFKSVANNYSNGSTVEGDDVYASLASGVPSSVVVGDKDLTRCVSGVAYIIYFEGLNNTGVAAPVINVEYVYHLEGTSEISGTTGTGRVPAMVPSLPPVAFPGTTALVENAINAVAGPNAFTWVSRGTTFLNSTSKAVTGKSLMQNAEKLAGFHPMTKGIFGAAKMFMR